MYEYKVVPAPQRAVKVKGLKSTAERFAHALSERINAEAAGGWEFLRTETLSCEERSGLGRARVSTQTVMVFGRALGQARPDAGAALAAVQGDQDEAWHASALWPQDHGAEGHGVEGHGAEGHGAEGHAAANWAEPADEPRQAGDHGGDGPAVERGPRAEPQIAPLRRQEPVFRSGGLLHGDRPTRAEPVIRPPRAERHDDES